MNDNKLIMNKKNTDNTRTHSMKAQLKKTAFDETLTAKLVVEKSKGQKTRIKTLRIAGKYRD